MFSTFESAEAQLLSNRVDSIDNTRNYQEPPSRPKRSQVSRACNSCRVHRIKCDAHTPCKNCRTKGANCTKGPADVQSLPEAIREIEVLRARAKELETQLQSRECLFRSRQISPSSPVESVMAVEPTKDNSAMNRETSSKTFWQGIRTQSALSKETQYYGPASSFYFIGRMSSFLTKAFSQAHSDRLIQPDSASRTYASPSIPRLCEAEDSRSLGANLTEIQEEYLLGLFWQSYNCTYQIVMEEDFKKYYQSLRATPGSHRSPSALVDIILALSIQLGAGIGNALKRKADTIPQSNIDASDATIAGRFHYCRCQTLLTSELESPSIPTLQCQLLSLVYLCNASFQNTAHSMSALAVRTAHILGLHLEPTTDLPRPEREFRKRLWWTLYAVETKTSMKLGRPSAVQNSHTNCNLPADDHELAHSSASTFATVSSNVTWLTYNLQCTKLILIARRIYDAFFEECATILSTLDGRSLYDETEAFERSAKFLEAQIPRLRDWVIKLPSALCMNRRQSGRPYSFDGTALDIELFAPLWLQRQRLILELLYHNLSMNLYRPFIGFPSKSKANTSWLNSYVAVQHAIVITDIMCQTLTETDILNGWHEAFQWQWNASITMCGFVLSDFDNIFPSLDDTREPLHKAIKVFEMMGKSFAISASAANVVRNLVDKVDVLVKSKTRQTGIASASSEPRNETDTPTDKMDSNQPSTITSGYSEDLFGGTMGLSFTVDATTDFEALWAGSVFDIWAPPSG